MPGIESRTEAAWVAKQAVKGTPAGAAIKRGRKVGGDMNVAREDGSQPWSDGQRFATAEDFISTLVGNGNPILQGQPGVLAYLLYLMMGQETVTSVAGPAGLFDHVATPASTGAFWTTWWKLVGATVGPLRQKFNDCRLSSLRIEGSSAQKVLQATPTWVSVDPGEVYSSDPVQAEDTDRALLYTEGEGRFKLNGAVFRGHSSFAFNLNDAVTPWYGDSSKPHEVTFGASAVDLEGITLLVDQQGKDFYDEQIYGMTSPPAGTKPRTGIPVLGSYELDLKRGTVIDVSIIGATAGNFTLTVDGQTTGVIAFNSTAAATQTIIEALANVIVGDVIVTGGPLPGTPLRIVFLQTGRVVTGTFTGLTGGANSATDRGPEKRAFIEFPSVKWAPDMAIPGNPEGGAVELALGAQARKVGANPIVRSTVRCGDAAYV